MDGSTMKNTAKRSKVLFLANLPESINEKSLRDYMSQYVRPVRGVIFRDKNEGLLEMENENDAEKLIKAIRNNGTTFMDKKIRILYSEHTSLPNYDEQNCQTSVLLVSICANIKKIPQTPYLVKFFNQFGSVYKLVPFHHKTQNQIFVQYSSPQEAKEALVYITEYPLRINNIDYYFDAQFSKNKDVTIKRHANCYINPDLITENDKQNESIQNIIEKSKKINDYTNKSKKSSVYSKPIQNVTLSSDNQNENTRSPYVYSYSQSAHSTFSHASDYLYSPSVCTSNYSSAQSYIQPRSSFYSIKESDSLSCPSTYETEMKRNECMLQLRYPQGRPIEPTNTQPFNSRFYSLSKIRENSHSPHANQMISSQDIYVNTSYPLSSGKNTTMTMNNNMNSPAYIDMHRSHSLSTLSTTNPERIKNSSNHQHYEPMDKHYTKSSNSETFMTSQYFYQDQRYPQSFESDEDIFEPIPNNTNSNQTLATFRPRNYMNSNNNYSQRQLLLTPFIENHNSQISSPIYPRDNSITMYDSLPRNAYLNTSIYENERSLSGSPQPIPQSSNGTTYLH